MATTGKEAVQPAGLKGMECDHAKTEVRRRVCSNGSRQYVYQCLNCGQAIGNAIPVIRALKNGPVKDFDLTLRETWEQWWHEHWLQQKDAEILQRSAADTEWRERYEAVMQSPEWEERRQLVFKRCNRVCEGCGKNRAVQVHHRTYEHLGNEFLWELVGVCLECHERVHSHGDNHAER